VNKQVTNRLLEKKDAILHRTTKSSMQNIDDIAVTTEIFALETTKGLTSMVKLKFKRIRENALQESSGILVDTLKIQES
jgi:hypothetical protein